MGTMKIKADKYLKEGLDKMLGIDAVLDEKIAIDYEVTADTVKFGEYEVNYTVETKEIEGLDLYKEFIVTFTSASFEGPQIFTCHQESLGKGTIANRAFYRVLKQFKPVSAGSPIRAADPAKKLQREYEAKLIKLIKKGLTVPEAKAQLDKELNTESSAPAAADNSEVSQDF